MPRTRRARCPNLIGATETMASVPWFWSDQYEFTLQIAWACDGAERPSGATWRRGPSSFFI